MSADWESLLIKKIKKGDAKAFDALYHSYFSKLFGFTFKLTHSREDSEEIVQEVFIKIWEMRNELNEYKSFSSLLFTVARHKIYNKTRHRVYEFAYIHYFRQNHEKAISDVQLQIDYLDTKHFLDQAIESLPAKRKQIFLMSRTQGLTNKEIADKLNTSVSNIENHINKTLKTLKNALANQEMNLIFLLLFFQ